MANRGVLLVAALCGCDDEGRTPIDAPPEIPSPIVATAHATVNRNVDILFVIDDSNGMAGAQLKLASAFPAFLRVLSEIEGGLPDVHIGVVSTDMGTKPLDGG